MSNLHEMFSTDEFVEKIIRGDKEAQNLLVSEYTRQIYRASFGLGFKNEEADELVQRTWLTFFETVGRFEKRSHIRTFLFGILYFKAQELRRSNFKQFKMESIDGFMDEQFDDKGEWLNKPLAPDRFMESIQAIDNIKDCLEDIPLNYRMAFILKEIEEQDSKEICKILEVTDTNLGVLLFRAKNKLRTCLEKKHEFKK